jgi:4-hydroxyphenylpyruvate dioxygenase
MSLQTKTRQALTLFGENPLGTDGFEFLEFASPDPQKLMADFEALGFMPAAVHRSKKVSLFQQGGIHFIVNEEPGFATEFAALHGASTCAMGFRVLDADVAFEKAVAAGATPYVSQIGPGELQIPAIYGIGGSVIYFVDRYNPHGMEGSIYEVDFKPRVSIESLKSEGAGLTYIDHVTHNVHQGGMDRWAGFYHSIFNFKEIRYFDIEGQLTGLLSRAMTSPCGKIRIPINEGTEAQSQIEEFLREYNGEGIQHIALGASNIYHTVAQLREQGIAFLEVPDTYYEAVDQRVGGHQEDLAHLHRLKILIDGAPTDNQGLLLQIFTQNMLGPVFFEIIQRKGNEGFGEGNFRALFESIERDQVRRGVL